MSSKYRWLKGWAYSDPMAVALRSMLKYELAMPRVGNLFPGVTTPVPSGPYGGDLPQLCRDRAAQLWEKFDTLFVLWSGGTDSTLAAALLAEHKPGRLILSTSGREEKGTGPEIYQWFIDHGCEFEDATTAAMRQVAGNGGMVLTGNHADSLLLGEYADVGEKLWDMELEEAVMAHTGVTQEWAKRQISACQPFFDYLELDHTVPNLCWWLDFAACWDQDEMSAGLMYHLDPPGVGYETFFGTAEFQRWAAQPVQDKVGRGDKAHKYRYHEIIESIFGFKPTLVARNNEPLDSGVVSRLGSFLAIREDWSLVTSDRN